VCQHDIVTRNFTFSTFSQVNSKLSSLEEERRSLTNSLSHQKEENALLNKDKQTLLEQKSILELQISALEDRLVSVKEISIQLETERNLKSYFEMQNEQEKRERIAATAQFLAVQNELQKKVIDAEKDLKSVRELKDTLIMSLQDEAKALTFLKKDQEETIFGLREEIASLHSVLKEKQQFAEKFQGISVENARNLEQILAEKEKSYIAAVEELSYCRGELEKLKSKLSDSLTLNEVTKQDERRKLQELEEKLQVSEQTRRKLFNVIQELRGNIRVFARVRPFLPNDFPRGADQSSYPEGAIIPRADLNVLKIKRSANAENKKDKEESFEFSFDRVFGPSMSQEGIFQEVSEFVQSALDGYQVCLFSYGQTGSGKVSNIFFCYFVE
jgi:kinesin family protein C1